ncbi:MAG: LCP family protein [Chloroflexi bacterium]|nr:LCP family protein [Chloroflexota bacterium]
MLSRRSRGLQVLLFLFLSLFGCGALASAYEIFDTTREAVLTLGVPDLGNLSTYVSPIVQVVAPSNQGDSPNLALGERVNVLIMGIDRRPSESCPCRTDTMMLATLDPKTMTAALLTIPRDLYVPIPGVGEDRINTANLYGDLKKLPGGGPALAKKTVELNLGRRVHYYVIIDFSGFRKAVDAIGGIDINVPKAIDDPTYPDENYGYKPLHIPAGKIHMNGELALEYARTRHVDNDFGRMKRQIQVMMAIRDKAMRLDILPQLPGLLRTMWGSVQTDMTPQDVIALAQIAAKIKTEDIKTASIDDTMTADYRTSAGAAVLWPDRVKIGRLVDQLIPEQNVTSNQPNDVKSEAARLLVLNGTKVANLAESTAALLQGQGYTIDGFGNADRFDYEKTVLIDYTGNKKATVTALATLFHVDPNNIRRSTSVSKQLGNPFSCGS